MNLTYKENANCLIKNIYGNLINVNAIINISHAESVDLISTETGKRRQMEVITIYCVGDKSFGIYNYKNLPTEQFEKDVISLINNDTKDC